MKVVLTIALYAVLAGLLATQPRADDIDIYQGTFAAQRAPLRIMFALDLRSEGADVVCNDASHPACSEVLGEELYTALDLFGFKVGGEGLLIADRSSDGLADRDQTDPDNPMASIVESWWPGTAVDRYDVLRAALRVVLTNLGSSPGDGNPGRRVEVGLMATHADDCGGAGPAFAPDFSLSPARGCSQGAYVLKGFTNISEPQELDKLLLALAALPDPGRRAPWMTAAWSGHLYKIRDVYLELYRYLSGQAVFNGYLGTRDYASRQPGNLYHFLETAVPNDVLLMLPDGSAQLPLLAPATDVLLPSSFDLASDNIRNARYVSPIVTPDACARVTMVNLQFGAGSTSHGDTNAAIAAPVAGGGLGLSLAEGVQGDLALITSLAAPATAGLDGAVPRASVRSFFFAKDISAASNTMAAAGGTGLAYTLGDPKQLVPALESVFTELSGESSTLVAGSTVVNDTRQARPGADIYFALFQPEAGSLWAGNIKKLKIAGVGSSAADGQPGEILAQAPLTSPPKPAISEDDGMILPDALTFWTDPAGADVLAFDSVREEVPGRDGRSVTRGGAGQQIRGFLGNSVGSSNRELGARQVFTLDTGLNKQLIPLDAAHATLLAIAPHLDPSGTMTAEQQLDLIRWIRGQDSLDADGDGNRTESRPWLLGAPLHSRPLAVSYGARPGTSYSPGNPDIRIFFGSNAGFLHVVRNTEPSGAESGEESWAFIPPEMLRLQSALSQTSASALSGYQYGLDGEAVALVKDRDRDGTIDASEGDSVWVFIGQRRGGKGLYAFDMTDPDNPGFMWHIDNQTVGFEQLALTFSTPRVAHLDLGQVGPTPVLIFAGGYNGGWQGAIRIGKDAGAAPDFTGNSIYVVNPEDGSLIWRAVGPDGGATPESADHVLFVASLEHSIPSPVSVVDADRNGVDDRAYVGDTGGNLWRLDFTEAPSRKVGTAATGADNWYLSRLATLGGSGDSDRRFFHAPDVVQTRDEGGDYDGVVILSGDRAAPGDTDVRNFAYLIKDRNKSGAGLEAFGSPHRHSQFPDVIATCSSGDASNCVAQELDTGWKLELAATGEKGLSTPLVTNGQVFFTTYVPGVADEANRCDRSEGLGRLYVVSLKDGSPAAPRPGELELEEEEEEEPEVFQEIGPGLHGDVVPYGDQVLVPGSGAEEGPIIITPGRTRWRAYWREENVDFP